MLDFYKEIYVTLDFLWLYVYNSKMKF